MELYDIKKPATRAGLNGKDFFRDPDWIRTNDLLLSLPTTGFPASSIGICGLDYIFTIPGVPRVVSTEPF